MFSSSIQPMTYLTYLMLYQQMRGYLEPLFVHSEEVKKELPLASKRFENIRLQVKTILLDLSKAKKVRSAPFHVQHRMHVISAKHGTG